MAIVLEGAGKGLGNEGAFEELGFGGCGGRETGGGGEHVYRFEDEEAGEGTAEVGYTVGGWVLAR